MSSYAENVAVEEAADTTQVEESQAETQPEGAAPPAEETGEQEHPEAKDDLPPHLQKRLGGLESALSAERKRAQEYQRELDYLKGKVDSRQAEAPKPPPPIISEDEFWADPVKGSLRVASIVAQTAVSQAEAARIDRASARMRAKHEDYAEIEKQFLQAVQFRPSLRDEALMSDNPAEYVYEWGKAQQQASDTVALQKRIAELEAQIAKGKPVPPRTQAGARSANLTAAGGDDEDPYTKSY